MIKDYYVKIPPHLSDVLSELGNTTSEDFDTIIAAGRAALFNFSYTVPVADKEALETFICNRFTLRRIGSGNVKKWRQLFKWKILEIMPYYGKLLESEHLEFDPLINNDIETQDAGTGTLGTVRDKTTDNDDAWNKSGNHSSQYAKSGSENAQNTELNRYSDTPQGDSSRIWETDAQGNVRLTDYYVTDVRGIMNNGSRSWTEAGNDSGTTAESGTDSRDITEHETIATNTADTHDNKKLGVSGNSKSNLLNEYRETFLRIYTNIAEELEPLFYNLVEVDDLIDFV